MTVVTADMRPARLDLLAARGAPIHVVFTADFDLTGYTDWVAQAVDQAGTVSDFTIDDTDQADGVITATLDTTGVKIAAWHFAVTLPNGDVAVPLVAGTIRADAV